MNHGVCVLENSLRSLEREKCRHNQQLSNAAVINISLFPFFLPCIDSAAAEAKVRKCKILMLHAVIPTGTVSVFVHVNMVKVPF